MTRFFFFFTVYSATESESDILGICALHLTHPECTHTHTHSSEHTHTHTRSSGQPFILHFNVGHNGGSWKAKYFLRW